MEVSNLQSDILLAAIPDMLFVVDAAGIVLQCTAVQNAFTLLCGESIYTTLSIDLADQVLQAVGKTLKEGGESSFEYQLVLGGQRTDWEFRIACCDKQSGLVIVRDITEGKKNKREMDRLEKVYLVGEIAAEIGHEVRNPLTTVRGFLQMYRVKKENTRYDQYIDLMLEEIDRANAVITKFIALAQKKALTLKYDDLNRVIREVLPEISALAEAEGKHITARLDKIPYVLLDEKEIRKVILQLTRNGLEAMQAGGILAIRTFMENGKIVVTFQDEGKGIDAEALGKLGTPFYSTKEDAIGLGLALCYSIAARHKANIDVDTNGNGTTFSVQFPID
jgi:two-component system, sporulation sensor kinase E